MKTNVKTLLVPLVLLLAFVLSPAVYASDTFKYGGPTPDKHISYTIERAREKISTIFLSLFNKKGLGDYEVQLLDNRANELMYEVDHEKTEFVETTVSRYISQTGLVKDQLQNGNVKKEKVLNVLNGLPEKFATLRDTSPSQSAGWLLMQQAIDSTNTLTSEAQK